MRRARRPHAGYASAPRGEGAKALIAALTIMAAGAGAIGCGNAEKAPSSGSATRGAMESKPASARTSGGPADESVQAYRRTGYKTNPADAQSVRIMVKRYYAAAAANDGARACSLFQKTFATSIPEDYGQPPGPAYLRGRTCAVVMSKFFRHLASVKRCLSGVRVMEVRMVGTEAAALLRIPTIGDSELLLRRDGDSWKVSKMFGYRLS
jgi:hypothetical protein